MKRSSGILPQDVALLLKLVANADREWKQIELAVELGLPQGEIAKALKRLNRVNLLDHKKPIKSLVKEFITYSVKFNFPGTIGPICKGVPTSISFSNVRKDVVAGKGVENTFVIPSPLGKALGQSVEPLYKNLSEAVLKDPKFHEMIANLDMLRVGKAREKKIALKYFEKKLA